MDQTSKLNRIAPGISVQEALRWLCEGCRSDWALLSKCEQYTHIRALRSLLSDPLTAEQAEALRAIGGGRQNVEEVLDWLRHPSLNRRQHRKMLMQRILNGLGRHAGAPRQAYTLDFAAPGEFKHTFGGAHCIPGGDCPNCAKPFLRILSLDAHDPRLRLGRPQFRFLHLVYCWTCVLPSDYFVYRQTPRGRLDLLYFARGAPAREALHAGYPRHFEGRRVGFTPLTRRDQAVIRVFNTPTILAPAESEERLLEPRHQIGGEPHLIAPLHDMLCPCCGRAMPLLASVCDNAGGPSVHGDYEHSFAGSAETQLMFHYCRLCCVAGAYPLPGWDGSGRSSAIASAWLF